MICLKVFMDIFLKNNINMLKELLIVILSIWIVLHVELCAVLQTTVVILSQANQQRAYRIN